MEEKYNFLVFAEDENIKFVVAWLNTYCIYRMYHVRIIKVKTGPQY